MMRDGYEQVGRRKPAVGVWHIPGQPTIVYVTVCADQRMPWIAQPPARDLIIQAWSEAQSWLVGYYLLMPDHLHFFCAPHDLHIPFHRWMSYWKRLFTQRTQDPAWRWQSLHWDRRLRRTENYQQKWQYIRENPVRKGLVQHSDDWPYQGMLNALPW